jgi:uncharacterized protein
MFPLSTVVFPGADLPLHVFEPRYRQLIADVERSGRGFGTVLISAGSEVGGGDRRCQVGCWVSIEMLVPLEDGRSMLVCRGQERIEVTEWLDDDPYPRAVVRSLPSEGSVDPILLEAAAIEVRRVRRLLCELDDGPCPPIGVELSGDPAEDQWMVCALAPIGLFDSQRLLEVPEADDRLRQLVEVCRAKSDDLSLLLSERGRPSA